MSDTTVSLEKGQKVDLTKSHPGLSKLGLGLGWDVKKGSGSAFDLDAAAIMLDANKKLLHGEKKNVIFFGNLAGPGVNHSGDNLTGEGEGDDEVINVDLNGLPSDCSELLLVINIYEAENRKQNFGQVERAFVRAFDGDSKEELHNDGKPVRFDLSEDYSAFNAMVMGKIYRHEGEWKFQAIGEGKNGNLNKVIEGYTA